MIGMVASAIGYTTQCSGPYRIIGTVTELDVAGSYRVRLYRRFDGRLVQETFSSVSGGFAFNYVAYLLNGYYAIAFDHGGSPLNASIADFITPEPMP